MVMARCLVHRDQRTEALAWLNLERGIYLVSNLEGACEVMDPATDLEMAVELIELARAEAERGGVEALPLYADRLEARVALERGDHGTAARLLDNAATGFDRLGASWEAANSRLLLAESLNGASAPHSTEALAVFERLGSLAEARRIRARLEGTTPV